MISCVYFIDVPSTRAYQKSVASFIPPSIFQRVKLISQTHNFETPGGGGAFGPLLGRAFLEKARRPGAHKVLENKLKTLGSLRTVRNEMARRVTGWQLEKGLLSKHVGIPVFPVGIPVQYGNVGCKTPPRTTTRKMPMILDGTNLKIK